ncbi:hypothetical protein NMG60_11015145 [Bertholletia excelsa]
MAAVTAAVVAIAGLVLAWIAIEIACKPCLEKGREAIDRNLNPDYDPDDDENIRQPLNPNPPTVDIDDSSDSASSPIVIKEV